MTTCDKCGYEWEYSGNKPRTICPNCNKNVRTGKTAIDTDGHFAQLKAYREELPEEYASLLMELCGSGRGVRTSRAAIEWVRTNKTQKELEAKYDVTAISIRNVAKEIGSCDIFFSDHDNFDNGLHQIFTLFDYKALQWWAKGSDTPVNGQSSVVDIAEQLAIQDNTEGHMAALKEFEERDESGEWLSPDNCREVIERHMGE